MTTCCPKDWIKFFKAAGDEHRQKILDIIGKHSPINATDIQKHIKLSQPTLSHHLSKLFDAKLIQTEKRGKETFYKINDKGMFDCCMGFMKKFSQSD